MNKPAVRYVFCGRSGSCNVFSLIVHGIHYVLTSLGVVSLEARLPQTLPKPGHVFVFFSFPGRIPFRTPALPGSPRAIKKNSTKDT